MLIQQLLNEDLTLAPKGIRLRNKRSTLHPSVPKSNESFVHNFSDQFGEKTDSTGQLSKFSSTSIPSHSSRIKRGFAAFIPALASLATIAVESIGSFLQKKHNTALSKGPNAIKSDQLLVWNLDSLEKIIHTVNLLGERVHRMEELLMGKDQSVATQQFLHASYIGRLLFAHKLNVYLMSVQETMMSWKEFSENSYLQ